MPHHKPFQTLFVLLLLALLLVSCGGSSKKGVVHGVLVMESGEPLVGEYLIVLCKMDANSDNCALSANYRAVTVDGEFTIKNVEAGQYAIYLQAEGGIDSFLEKGAGETLVIIVEEGKDFDLGTITLK